MSKSKTLFKRKPLSDICSVPDEIIDVYVVEHHIWSGGGADKAKQQRKAELKTVRDFLIEPVRPLLNDVLRQLASPYDPSDKTTSIGQGWWIQAEFGSGKSHLLSFIGALALGDEEVWKLVQKSEADAGKGKRESIYQFYENGLAKKSQGKSKGIFVAVKTLVGQGGGTIGATDTGRKMSEYILDAVQDQYFKENGKGVSLYPVEVLADRFEKEDYERYHKDLAKFLKDPTYFDEEEQEELSDFLNDLRDNKNPTRRRDCGQRLWRFYREFLKTTPRLPMETEDVMESMVNTLLADGYEGVLLILDEVSLFMKNRTDEQKVEDEKTLIVLSNRLAKNSCLPVWTICSAQQAIESKMGVRNIIAKDRLKNVALLQDEKNFYDIVLSRCRTITNPDAIDPFYDDYRNGFTWPESEGKEKFKGFFPFYPPAIDVLRGVSYKLTTLRSSVHFMHQTLKTQMKSGSNELLSLWQMFDDVVSYEEDPSGTTAGIAAISASFNAEWKAYESGKKSIYQATKGRLKVYSPRCEKILKTLFLYHIAQISPNGLTVEQIMNAVMEWQDHDGEQQHDKKDNQDHYEILCEELIKELPQVRKVGADRYVFNPIGGGIDVRDVFGKARSQADNSPLEQRKAWEALLSLENWKIQTPLLTMDLAYDTKSIFREIAPAEQSQYEIQWNGRVVRGNVYMRDLLDIATNSQALPPIVSEQDQDFAIFISNKPCGEKVADLAHRVNDARVLFWTPDNLTQSERERLTDFAAYRTMVAEYRNKETEEAKEVLTWVASKLRDEIGTIYKIVPDSFGRGRICATDHTNMGFKCQGELLSIISPLVGQVLDATYACSSIHFSAPTPFNDAEAIKLINGIIRTGDIPKNTKPNKDISAAENYGYDLGVMKKTGKKELNTTGCVFVEDIDGWLETQFSDSKVPTVESVYKNFTGIGGPNGKNYGLSRRMIDIYLLALVRQAKVRITVSGKAASTASHIDYSNMGELSFNAALLGGMNQIQRLKAPEGWSVLAPYAAVLLDNEEIKNIQKDTEIGQAIMELRKFHQSQKTEVITLIGRLDDLFSEIEQHNPVADCLNTWKAYFETEITDEEPIDHFQNALGQAFGYKLYEANEPKQSEVDDLASRKRTWERAARFYQHDREVRAAYHYSKLEVEKDGVLGEIKAPLKSLRKKLDKLGDLIENEAALQSQLLDPLTDILDKYRTRFLQAYDQVTGKCEAVRTGITNLCSSAQMQALDSLAKIDALKGIDTRLLASHIESFSDGLFATDLDKNMVDRELRSRPSLDRCPLHVDYTERYIEQAQEAEEKAASALKDALVAAAQLLLQPALRSLMDQGRDEPFIANILDAANPQQLAVILAERLPGHLDNAKLLAKYLRQIQIKMVRLGDFKPSKMTCESDDVASVVEEFRIFLNTSFDHVGDNQSVVVSFEN